MSREGPIRESPFLRDRIIRGRTFLVCYSRPPNMPERHGQELMRTELVPVMHGNLNYGALAEGFGAPRGSFVGIIRTTGDPLEGAEYDHPYTVMPSPEAS